MRIERVHDGGAFGGCPFPFSSRRGWQRITASNGMARFRGRDTMLSMTADDPERCRGVSRRPPSPPSGMVQRAGAAGLGRRRRGLGPTLLGIGMILLVGCPRTNHYLIHPRKAAPELSVWSADFARGDLKMHIEGARPPGAGPFPTILVFPEEERTASDMHGVIWDLAA